MKLQNFIKMVISYLITFLLGNFIPKNKNLVVLSSNQGKQFVGNGKALYSHLSNNTNLEVYYYVQDRVLLEKLRSESVNVLYNFSFKAVRIFLRARTVAVTHGFADFLGYFPSFTQNWVYLGHGIGTKALGYLKEELSFWEKIRLEFLKSCYFLSTSDFDRYMWCTMYGLKPKKVPVVGYPRNDCLLQESSLNHLKVHQRLRVLYAPTYRKDGIVQLFPFSDFELQTLSEFLDRKDFFTFKNIKDLSPDVLEDVQDFLSQVDILITDFSSISRDFLFLDRPIIFIMNGIEKLGNLALPIRKEYAFCGYQVSTFKEFENALKDILEGKDKYAETRRFVRDLSYNYIDNKSSERVTELIKKLA